MTTEPNENSFSQAKIANEVIKVEKSKHQLKKLKDSVIDKQSTHDHVVQLIQSDRAEWQAWPNKVLAVLVTRLSVTHDQLQDLLQTSIEHHLQELGDLNVRLH